MINRRLFLRSAAGAALGGLVVATTGCARENADAPGTAGAPDSSSRAGLARIGVQLYTVRSLMESEFEKTIEQVDAIGYDEVEFAGYYEQSPADVRALLDRLGLVAPAVHVGYHQLQTDLDRVIADAKIIGHRYIVCPWLGTDQRASADAYRGHAAFFNEVGARCRDEGLRFAYHNHDFEFDVFDGRPAYDLLLEETDPERVDMELDLYWITKAGYDPLDYFERYPGRFKLFHVKDMADRSGAQDMAPVGSGEIDFATILAQAEAQGGEHYFVEHDNAADPMASLRASYQHLAGLAL